MKNFVFWLGCLLITCLMASPFALADTIDLTVNNNCGSTCNPAIPPGTTIAVVTLTQSGSNVLVSVQAQSGFSLKIEDGNDVNFNGPSGLTVTNLTVDGTGIGSDFSLGTGGSADGFGKFSYNLMSICDPKVCFATSASNISFTVTGATVAQLETANAGGGEWAIHFCDASGTNCAPSTGYVSNGGATVPEPGMLAMLFAGLVPVGRFVYKFRRV